MFKTYKYIIIIFFLFCFSAQGEFGVVPMASVTWDNNIGFNYGVGLALGKWGEGVFSGIYTSYSFSKKGNNLSFGPYAGAGIVTFRAGINRLKEKETGKTYWGIETSPTIIMGHIRAGVLKDNKKLKLSYALGLGLF